ncbi:hypothetical protein [Acidisphaera sp. L21]|uniref:hypothetical protein n=1 Tax=Acidisphaera sp. L21 TaxID=1641851 RepID=UPI001C204E97|nr:hypothetical protein [Acidisphaera sp. L21]
MAKTPGPPKAKAAPPAQFDLYARKGGSGGGGGKGGPGGPGRGRDEKRPPSRIINLPPTVVDRGEGWVIHKVGKVDQASHTPAGAEYQLVFEGHDPLIFSFLGAARDRSKEPPPEKAAPVEEPVAEEPIAEEPVAEEPVAEAEPAEDAPAAEASAEAPAAAASEPEAHTPEHPATEA